MSRLRAPFGRRGSAAWAAVLVVGGTAGPGAVVVTWLAVLGIPVDRMGGALQRVFICSLPLAALFLWALHAVGRERVFARRVTVAFFVWLEFLLLLLPPAAVRLGLLPPADLSIQSTLAMTAIFAALSLLIYGKALQVARKRQPSGSPAPQQ